MKTKALLLNSDRLMIIVSIRIRLQSLISSQYTLNDDIYQIKSVIVIKF